MKFFLIFVVLTVVHSSICNGQFADNFSDGEFTTNPIWNGDVSKFIIAANELKLQALPEASSAFIATPSLAINNAQWEFYVQMDFNPSNTNLVKIYLVADQTDLSALLNGYFVKVGNTDDEVSLYRQDGTTEIKIIDGTDKILNTSMVKVKIKVLRDASGNWQLFSDITNTATYTLEGNIFDNTYFESSFFGVRCIYTATRSDKFYFDDFVVTGDKYVDVVSPTLQEVKASSANQLELKFSENLDPISVGVLSNYIVNKGLGNPVSATLQSDQKTVNLVYQDNFPNGIECRLTTSGVKDVAGNVMASKENTFMLFKPELISYKDIIITEIFADPNPKIGLPEVEYIEIFNRSANPIDIAAFTFTDGSSVGKFPTKILFPEAYLIVTTSTAIEQFVTLGDVIGLASFPTLNNTGDSLVLKDAKNIVIDVVQYKDTWYKDEDKKQGGWSLELIDPANICAEGDNWIASEDAKGGTPGKQNSTFAIRVDNTGPQLLSAIPTTTNTIILQFNEKLDNGISIVNQFSIEPSIEITSASYTDDRLTSILLTFAEELQPKTLYIITANNVIDCTGNLIQNEFNKIEFGLPELPDSLDVVVNEILFNPRPTGVDFVEVYNKSSKYINLKNCSIASIENDSIINAEIITTTDILLKPLSYLVFTEDGNILKGEYVSAHENNFYQVNALPAFNDDEGSVAFISNHRNVIDYFHYNKSMHSPFIKDDEGVSLERITFKQPVKDIQNWKSASAKSSFATPGYINSNARLDDLLHDESVKVDPLIFMPVDGSPNFTQIRYRFDKGGYMANVRIHNAQGFEIKQLANNELLGTEGFFRWDGDEDNGSKVRVGYYFVSFEIFNEEGIVKRFRKRVIVATKF